MRTVVANSVTECEWVIAQLLRASDVSRDASEWLEVQRARLRIWSASLGVFVSGDMSLEYRLREMSDINNIIVQLLESIQIDFLKWHGLVQAAAADDASAQATAFATAEDDYTDETVGTVRLRIEDDIGRLILLESLIKRGRTVPSDWKASKYDPKDQHGTPLIGPFLEHTDFIMQTRSNIAIEPTLKKKLVLIMASRWRRLQYRQDQANREASKATLPPQSSSCNPGVPATEDAPVKENVPQESQRNAPASADNTSSFKAVSVAPGAVKSTMAPANAHLSFPPPPRPVKGAREFECPYCRILMPIAELELGRWRRHILKDLRPYFCTRHECQDSLETFVTTEEWLHHIDTHHSKMEWRCRQCNHVSDEEPAFKEHILLHLNPQENRAMEFQGSLNLLARSSRSYRRDAFESCAFCDAQPVGHGDEVHMWLLNHMATEHLQAYALSSIPWDLGDENSDVATGASKLSDEEPFQSSFLPTADEKMEQPAILTVAALQSLPSENIDVNAWSNDVAHVHEASEEVTIATGDEPQERLHSEYRLRGHKFFCFGRVFLILRSELAGDMGDDGIVANVKPSDPSCPPITHGPHGERYRPKFMRFIVIREGPDHCNACPIVTYQSRGVNKPGVMKSDQAVIYTGRVAPQPTVHEAPGKAGMRPIPIRVVLDDPADPLDPMSRVDLARIQKFKHNVKVRPFGIVHQDSQAALATQFANVWHSTMNFVPEQLSRVAASSSSPSSAAQSTTAGDSITPSLANNQVNQVGAS